MKMNTFIAELYFIINEKSFLWWGNIVCVVLLFSVNQAKCALFYDILDNLIVLLLEPLNLAKARECRIW